MIRSLLFFSQTKKNVGNFLLIAGRIFGVLLVLFLQFSMVGVFESKAQEENQVITIGPAAAAGRAVETTLCPDGTYVSGVALSFQDARGGQVTYVPTIYCRALQKGLIPDYTYRWLDYWEIGRNLRCAKDEYVKGFRSSSGNADKYQYSYVSAVACSKFYIASGATAPWQETFNFSGSGDQVFLWTLQRSSVGATAAVSGVQGSPHLTGPSFTYGNSVQLKAEPLIEYVLAQEVCDGYWQYDDFGEKTCKAFIDEYGTQRTSGNAPSAGTVVESGYIDIAPPPICWTYEGFVCAAGTIPYSGTVTASGNSTVLSTISATNPRTIPVTGSGDYIAGAGQLIQGMSMHHHDGPGGARAPRGIIDSFIMAKLQPPPPKNLSAKQPSSSYCGLTRPEPTLSWNTVSGITQTAYQIQISTDSSFNTIIKDTNKVVSTSESYLVSTNTLLYNTQYYWRTRIWDQSNAASDYASASFSTVPHRGPDVDFTVSPPKPPRLAVATYNSASSTFFGGARAQSYSWTFPPFTTLTTPPPTDAIEKVRFMMDAPKTGNSTRLVVTDTDKLTCEKTKGTTLVDPVQEIKEVR